METDKWKIRSYVRRQGKMSNLQRKSYNTLFDKYCLPFTGAPADLPSIFPAMEKVVIEIGFGMGITTAEIAASNPETGYLGIEVHTPGVGKLLSEIERRMLKNVRIIQYDAVEVVESMIGNGTVDGFHIFFPDPWPKKKHHKRRLLQLSFLTLIAPKLKEAGFIYVVTDWEEYAVDILKTIKDSKDFENSCDGFAPPLSWRPKTQFEKKGLQKEHAIFELYATRCLPVPPSRL